MTERDVLDEQIEQLYMVGEQVFDDGMRLEKLIVPDRSDRSPTRVEMQQMIANADTLLADNKQWSAPIDRGEELILDNPVSEWVYDSPGMREWRSELVPRAVALYPMQRPDIDQLPLSGGEIDPVARSFFVDALDSIGIRTRAKIMTSIADRYIEDGAKWVSLACGAAVPVLDALQSGRRAEAMELHLVDLDPTALDFAEELASERGVDQKHTLMRHELNLLRQLVKTDQLVDDLGEESADLVDALGIFEYFNQQTSTQFMKNAFRLVKPGGALIAANMLLDRPELDFNQRGIGWPKIFPRSIDQLREIIVSAGLPLEQVTMSIPQDGVYVVIEIRKPAQ